MREPWTFEDPSCKDIDTDLFYSERNREPENLDLIRIMCKRCPEAKDCLEWAIHNERFGVWAGTTEHQRKLIRRQRRIILKEEDSA